MHMDLIQPQPAPRNTDSPVVWPLIISDMERGVLIDPDLPPHVRQRVIDAGRARDAFGREKYGTPLQVENGREPIVDAVQEALDLMAYTRQHFERLKARGISKHMQLSAWRVHLTACACAAMVLMEEMTTRTP
jgi:hypothetical protein